MADRSGTLRTIFSRNVKTGKIMGSMTTSSQAAMMVTFNQCWMQQSSCSKEKRLQSRIVIRDCHVPSGCRTWDYFALLTMNVALAGVDTGCQPLRTFVSNGASTNIGIVQDMLCSLGFRFSNQRLSPFWGVEPLPDKKKVLRSWFSVVKYLTSEVSHASRQKRAMTDKTCHAVIKGPRGQGYCVKKEELDDCCNIILTHHHWTPKKQ